MICKISHISVLIFVTYSQFAQSLSKITIGLRPYQYQYVDPNYNLKEESIPVKQNTPEDQIPAFRISEIPDGPFQLDRSASAFRTMNIENTATINLKNAKPIIPKKKKTRRKQSQKLKKMHIRRIFKTRLITTTAHPGSLEKNRIDEEIIETSTKFIQLAPIFDADTGNSYTPAELNKICLDTIHVSKGFGISDIESFAKNNCFLIRLYYPSVTCSQINQLVGYCKENGLING